MLWLLTTSKYKAQAAWTPERSPTARKPSTQPPLPHPSPTSSKSLGPSARICQSLAPRLPRHRQRDLHRYYERCRCPGCPQLLGTPAAAAAAAAAVLHLQRIPGHHKGQPEQPISAPSSSSFALPRVGGGKTTRTLHRCCSVATRTLLPCSSSCIGCIGDGFVETVKHSDTREMSRAYWPPMINRAITRRK